MPDHKETAPLRAQEQTPQRPNPDRGVSDNTNKIAKQTGTATLPSWRAPQFNKHGHLVDPMRREYTKPTEPIDIEAALALPPPVNTFRHHLAKQKENSISKPKRTMTDADRKEEFERVKNSLKSWGQKPSSSRVKACNINYNVLRAIY